MSSAERNKAIVRRFEEELAKGNLDVIDELLAPGFMDRALVPGQGPTREDFKRSSAEFLSAFSYTSYNIEEQIAEGDTVVTKFRARGVRRGELARLPPGGTSSGEEETFEGIRIHRIVEGKIAEEWRHAGAVSSESGAGASGAGEALSASAVRAGAQGGQKHPACLAAQGGARPQRAGRSLRSTGQPGGGSRLRRLPLPLSGSSGVVVGDATGKGVPAALVMSTTCGMLQLAAQALGSFSPGEVLSRVNENILLARIPCPRCSSPASTPSSMPRVANSYTPTPAMTHPTCAVVAKLARHFRPPDAFRS